MLIIVLPGAICILQLVSACNLVICSPPFPITETRPKRNFQAWLVNKENFYHLKNLILPQSPEQVTSKRFYNSYSVSSFRPCSEANYLHMSLDVSALLLNPNYFTKMVFVYLRLSCCTVLTPIISKKKYWLWNNVLL